jgi:hypothetical protein
VVPEILAELHAHDSEEIFGLDWIGLGMEKECRGDGWMAEEEVEMEGRGPAARDGVDG